MTCLLARLFAEDRGAVAIETAIVTPVLLLMSLGAFDTSMLFARQMDLQNAAAEAAQIALAAAPTDQAAQDVVTAVIETSLDPDATRGTVVVLSEKYRCGEDDAYVDDSTLCPDHYARFIEISITETQTPMWSKITGVQDIDFNVVRMIQVG